MLFQPDDELLMLRDTAARLARERFAAKAAHWDRTLEAPLENLKPMADAGLTGITIDEAYGGSGATILHAVVAMEQIARVCPVTSAFILANCTAAELIGQFGTEEQKQRYLTPVAAGEQIGCWAMTEPSAGSAANDMTTKAIADGDHYYITGTKCFITRAAIASFYVTFARVGGEPGSKAIAAFIVEKDDPGVRIGHLDVHMGLRGGASAEVIYDRCKVHKSRMIVPPGSFGRIMKGLNQARVLNPTMCLGIAAEALDLSIAYARERKAFGQEIGRFQGIQWMLAEMATKVETMRTSIYRAAALLAAGDPDGPHQAAIAKLYTGRAAFEVVNDAMQIHGGYGYSSEFPIERMLRDVRALQLGGGTNEILKNRIAGTLLKMPGAASG
ncbi:MAG TPA: acyl-CoA dehydrogenase family protein [Ramlibacter sp.]|nr:acyl-CoA dehydrogenase family protein [Ramlibacter sp.]